MSFEKWLQENSLTICKMISVTCPDENCDLCEVKKIFTAGQQSGIKWEVLRDNCGHFHKNHCMKTLKENPTVPQWEVKPCTQESCPAVKGKLKGE